MTGAKLCLGTAQIGLHYGIANSQGMPSADQAFNLLQAAWENGIHQIDTASAYGEAEVRVGEWLRQSPSATPAIISKVPPLDRLVDKSAALQTAFDASCAALGRQKLDGYMCHRISDYADASIRAGLRGLREAGHTEAIGVSIYAPDDLPDLEDTDIVQAPFSLLNQAVLVSGFLDRCAAAGVRLFVRSVYLQGVVFMSPEDLPAHLQVLAPVLRRLRGLADESGFSVGELALLAIRDMPGVSSIVIGLDNVGQLADLMAGMRRPRLAPELVAEAFRIAADMPPEVVNPSEWKS